MFLPFQALGQGQEHRRREGGRDAKQTSVGRSARAPRFCSVGCGAPARDAARTAGLAGCGGAAGSGYSGTDPGSAGTLNGPANPRGPDGSRDRDGPSVSPQMQEQMAEHRNSERQKQLVADTEKLFQLAQQLRDEVAKSNKDQLAIPVVKKSEEIEKLARSVKEKMRGY